jgi:predicted RNase H-like nuclease (RuvC/YqgF family)
MTAGIGIGTAGLSLLAKAVVTKVSNDKFKQAAPTQKEKADLNGAMGEQSKAELKLNTVSKEMAEIDDELAKTRKEISTLKDELSSSEFSGSQKIAKQTEFNEKNLALNDLQKRRDDLTPRYENLKTDYEIAAKVTDRERVKVDSRNADASKSVQEFRALLDMSDSSMSVIQNIGKVISVYFFDSKASDDKIESEKFGYLVGFFASALQNTQKSQSQAGDGLATIRSSCDATIQGADSSITYAIKA